MLIARSLNYYIVTPRQYIPVYDIYKMINLEAL